MIHFLRDSKNRSILDLELFVKHPKSLGEEGEPYIELYSNVLIEPYSDFLLDNLNESAAIIRDFDELSQLRGWLWEVYFMSKKNEEKYFDDVQNIISNKLRLIAKKYQLSYITD